MLLGLGTEVGSTIPATRLKLKYSANCLISGAMYYQKVIKTTENHCLQQVRNGTLKRKVCDYILIYTISKFETQ